MEGPVDEVVDGDAAGDAEAGVSAGVRGGDGEPLVVDAIAVPPRPARRLVEDAGWDDGKISHLSEE